MNDLRGTIIPKSDQINADDLIGQTMTIKITGVTLKVDEQPVSINFEGDGGKPWKPGKSMRRVLVHAWGPDGNKYIGRSLTLYRDDKVQFGGLAVGGIRISHMTDINAPLTMALTITRANKKPFTVKPLVVEAPAKTMPTLAEWMKSVAAELAEAETQTDVLAIEARDDVRKMLSDDQRPKARDRLRHMIDEATARISPDPPGMDGEEEPGDDGGFAPGEDPFAAKAPA